jgi:hypothetical protein
LLKFSRRKTGNLNVLGNEVAQNIQISGSSPQQGLLKVVLPFSAIEIAATKFTKSAYADWDFSLRRQALCFL